MYGQTCLLEYAPVPKHKTAKHLYNCMTLKNLLVKQIRFNAWQSMCSVYVTSKSRKVVTVATDVRVYATRHRLLLSQGDWWAVNLRILVQFIAARHRLLWCRIFFLQQRSQKNKGIHIQEWVLCICMWSRRFSCWDVRAYDHLQLASSSGTWDVVLEICPESDDWVWLHLW